MGLITPLLMLPLLGVAKVTEIATNWQCQPISQTAGQPRGFWELEEPLRPVFSIPAISDILRPIPFADSSNPHMSGILTTHLLDGRILTLEPLALSPARVLEFEGRYLAAASLGGEYATVYLEEGSVNLVELLTGKLWPLYSPEDIRMGMLAFGPKDNLLAHASFAGAVEVWSLGGPPRLEARLEGGMERPSLVVFSPSGTRLAIVNYKGGIMILGLEADALVKLFESEESEDMPVSISAGVSGGREFFAVGYISGTVRASGFDGEELVEYQMSELDTPSFVSVAVDQASGALLAYTMRGNLLLASDLSSEASRWKVPGLTNGILGGVLLGAMDSALVTTINFTGSPVQVIGYTKGDRWPRFILEGLPGGVSAIWDLGDMGLLMAASDGAGPMGFYQICQEDLALAFASRSQ